MSNNFKNQIFLTSIVAILFSVLVLSGCDDNAGKNDKPLSKHIAVYNGTGAMDSSAAAIKLCLESGNRTVEFVNEQDVQSSLEDFGMIIFGAGNPLQMITSLGFTGKNRIDNLVETGGAFIGLGGGAYLAADSVIFSGNASIDAPLGFFQGTAVGPISTIAPLPNYAMALVNLEIEPINPQSIPSLNVLYYGGPSLQLELPVSAISIGTFAQDDQHAGFLFGYGFGRVVVCSVHPEFEENSDNDGTDFASDMVDPDPDWHWLLTMVEWGFEERL